jgi:ParB-like chromosome segregation protein Spo0J
MKKSKPEIPVKCAFQRMILVSKIKPNPRNSNTHPEKQITMLAKIIQSQGWRSPIVISKRSGLVVCGHGRLAAAKLMGLAKAPCDFQEFQNDQEELAHLTADNRLTELAETDKDALSLILAELDASGFDLQIAGFESLPKVTGNDVQDLSASIGEKYEVVIECQNEDEQQKYFTEMNERGIKCRLLTF